MLTERKSQTLWYVEGPSPMVSFHSIESLERGPSVLAEFLVQPNHKQRNSYIRVFQSLLGGDNTMFDLTLYVFFEKRTMYS